MMNTLFQIVINFGYIMNNAGTFKILTFAHILNLHEHLDNHLLLSV